MLHKCVKLPPEMTDGQHWTPVKMVELSKHPTHFTQWLLEWLDNAGEGDTVTLGVCLMTDEQIDALPDM